MAGLLDTVKVAVISEIVAPSAPPANAAVSSLKSWFGTLFETKEHSVSVAVISTAATKGLLF